MIQPFDQLICPLDKQPLQLNERTWRCENGHSYDVAKQGYVNLLPVQNKRSKDPGDSKSMVQARRHFLSQGFYQPLADALSDSVLSVGDQSILDAGCGEGYYLQSIVCKAEQRDVLLEVAALDISKWAVQAAAKQDKRLSWMVASNNAIPLANNSVDTILCVFGFPVEAEFKRVLKPGGRLIMVDPASEHLIELKRIIYPEIKAKSEHLPVSEKGWVLSSEERISFKVELPDTEAVHDLLTMTPHLYRASKEGIEKAEKLQSLAITADVWVRVFSLK
ncbi:rRNA (guanine-N1)-methyltransferase [Idiomarina sp. WRN-38]|uniref:putative RNA methyltransferase n=1 Tax=Idiomarina sp. OXR-189 TaxID=3100175 RepID=UPI0007337451|nr:methyltransferase domain-containing protein [Idiomarina sp. OXR-189]KTG24655.1 rRNA (guanine-N1)-methyltransferase [Idiomarina sp. H105]OAE93161.1 rRNA (guanine-N1)-methyltransferase [Idiomarina sp. WRN-38]WPZ01264.1 methyltransferase domain-containing protein [Idiomarina sp. OXR-189]